MLALDSHDYEAAARSLREAADGGDASAQYQLGILYEAGRGLPKNLRRAYLYYSLSAKQGSLRSKAAKQALEEQWTPDQIADAQRSIGDDLAKTRPPGDADDAMAITLERVVLADGVRGHVFTSFQALAPSYKTQTLLDEVLKTASLSGRTIAAYDVMSPDQCPNACAGMHQVRRPNGDVANDRAVLMNRGFFEADVADAWEAYAIVAHEVGHHANFHNISDPDYQHSTREDNWKRELEADEFAGNVVERMGANLDQAQSWFRSHVSESPSPTHPPRRQRLQAIEKGWRQAASVKGTGQVPEPENPRKREPAERKGPGDEEEQPDSQPYQPSPHQPGPQVPMPQTAQFCITPGGSCAMGQPVPIGSPCYCPTLFGPLWGVAR